MELALEWMEIWHMLAYRQEVMSDECDADTLFRQK